MRVMKTMSQNFIRQKSAIDTLLSEKGGGMRSMPKSSELSCYIMVQKSNTKL